MSPGAEKSTGGDLGAVCVLPMQIEVEAGEMLRKRGVAASRVGAAVELAKVITEFGTATRDYDEV